MRIGVDYRFVNFGSSVTKRGMGRFSQQQLRAVLATEEQNEYVLLCREGFDADQILLDIRNDRKVRIRCLPPLASIEDGESPNYGRRALRLDDELQAAVAAERLDLFHATTPFLFGDLVPQRIESCPYVATHYDLIPLVYPGQYFPGEQDRLGRQAYERALRYAARAQRLAAISGFVKEEAAIYLGTPHERIDVAYPFADPAFAPMAEAEAEAAIGDLRGRLGLEGDFVVSVTHLHFSKNLEGLLRGFAELQRRGRFAGLGLVVVCGLESGQGRYIRDLAWQCGVQDHLHLTDLISDTELAGLFNRCSAALLLSRYEGFGLPALEALQCGAPVVASATASIPEIVGSAALLVDPDAPVECADAVERLLSSGALREELGGRGLEQSRRFDGQRLADATLECYRRAAEPPAERPRRVSVWSPMPPQESGVADYSFELVEWLEQHVEVEVVVDQGVAPELPRQLRATFRLATDEGTRGSSRDRVVFQFGGSHFHLFQFAHLDAKPDLLVLHDLTWGRVRWFAARGDVAALEKEVADSEGEAAAQELRRIIDGTPHDRLGEAAEEFFLRHFLLRPVVSASSQQVVHFLGGAEALEERYPEANACYVPMGVADPFAAIPFHQRSSCTAPRHRQHLEVGIFGTIDPVKRLESVADSVLLLDEAGVDVRVSVVGTFVSPEYRHELESYLRERSVADRFRFHGRGSDETFRRCLLDCDVVVNLRWPFRYQMSASLLRAVAAGKPVVATDVPAWGMLPETFCRFLPPGEREAAELARELATLAHDREERRKRGAAARSFYREHATLEIMGRRYLELLGIEPRVAPTEPARRLGACGIFQVDHAEDAEVAWALERLVPDPTERAERVRCAGGVGGSLAEAATSLVLLRRFGALAPGRRIVVIGEVAPRLLEVVEDETGRVLALPPALEQGARDADSASANAWDRPPWQTFRGDSSADAVVVARRLAIDTPRELSATVGEALRILRPGGHVIVSFGFDLAGPRHDLTAGWTASLRADEVEEWLVRSTGGVAVEPFDARPSPATREAPRVLTLEPEYGLEPPVEIVSGRVLCPGILSLQRPATWTPPGPPPDESCSEWVRRRDSKEGFAGLPPRATVETYSTEVGIPVVSPREPTTNDHSDLRRLLRRWDDLRARTSIEGAPSGNIPIRIGGFVLRSARRLRDLGIAWDRLRDVLVALVDRHLLLRREVLQLQQEAARTRDVLGELVVRVDSLAAQVEAAVPPAAAAGVDPPWFEEPVVAMPRPSEMHALLLEIGRLEPILAKAGAIEVSFAGTQQVERPLEVALRMFGERMACMEPEGYRTRNDFWIHVELCPEWPPEMLVRNARFRLGEGARLIVVTEAQGPAPPIEGMTFLGAVASRAVPGVRLGRWRRDGSAA
jgi:glycosyltransferase involved in cell wall biosynthesis